MNIKRKNVARVGTELKSTDRSHEAGIGVGHLSEKDPFHRHEAGIGVGHLSEKDTFHH